MSSSQDQIKSFNKNLFDFSPNSSNDYDLKNWFKRFEEIPMGREPIFLKDLVQVLFDIDPSSVNPNFEPSTSSSLIESFKKELDLRYEREFDDYIKISPLVEFKIKVKLTSIETAEPKIDLSGYELSTDEE